MAVSKVVLKKIDTWILKSPFGRRSFKRRVTKENKNLVDREGRKVALEILCVGVYL